MNASADDLYKLPKLPSDLAQLQRMLDAAHARGLVYCPPVSGANRQAVQFVDIDGDGVDEAFAFFSSEDKPLLVYYYKYYEDNYIVGDIIEFAGVAFDFVNYTDLNGDGILGLAVGVKLTDDLKRVSLFGVTPGNQFRLTGCGGTDYIIAQFGKVNDLPGENLICVRTAADRMGLEYAAIWLDSGFAFDYVSARLSSKAHEPVRVHIGLTTDGKTAAFIDSRTVSGSVITDIIVSDAHGELVSLNRDGAAIDTERSGTPRYSFGSPATGVGLFPVKTDTLNSEIKIESGEICYWYSIDTGGGITPQMIRYYCEDDSWSFEIDKAWIPGLSIKHDDDPHIYGERAIVFSIYNASGEPEPFLRIYILSGDRRRERGEINQRFIILDDGNCIYSGELYKNTLKESEVISRFSKILPEWIEV